MATPGTAFRMRSKHPLALSILICLSVTGSAPSQVQPDRVFKEWDKNKDGKLTRTEVPKRNRGNFDRVDKDKNNFISLQEHLDFMRGGARQQDRRAPSTKNLRILKDIPYAATDNPRQTLDLALPKQRADDKPLAVLVYIHGGAWRNGSKRGGLSRIANFLQTKRYAGVSIGYRLTPEQRWPAQIHDCKAAIRWIKAHAKQYGLDPNRIAACGDSAGGHLVSMLGVSAGNKDLEGTLGKHSDQTSTVAAVINYFGPSQLLLLDSKPGTMVHDAPDSPEGMLIGGPIQQHKQATLLASPLHYVNKPICPFLIIHGTKDMIIPCHQAEILDAALDKHKSESILIRVTGAGHGVGGRFLDETVLRFVDHHLFGQKATFTDQTIQAADLAKGPGKTPSPKTPTTRDRRK